MTELSARIESALAAPDRELQLQNLVTEVCIVLASLQRATKSSPAFADRIQFTIRKKRDARSKVLSKIQNYNPREHEGVVRFLAQIERGTVAFWNPQIQRSFTSEQKQVLKETPWSVAAIACVALEEVEIHHHILRRFARLAVYRLNDQGRSVASIARVLQRSGFDTTEKEVDSFISAGSRYSNLTKSLGIEFLFFLPTTVPASDWELKIPKDGVKALEQSLSTKLSEVSSPFRQLAENLLASVTNPTAVPQIFTWLEDTVGRPAKRPRLDHTETITYEAVTSLIGPAESGNETCDAVGEEATQDLQMTQELTPIEARGQELSHSTRPQDDSTHNPTEATPRQVPPDVVATHPLNCRSLRSYTDCVPPAGTGICDEQAGCRAILLCGDQGSTPFGSPPSVNPKIRRQLHQSRAGELPRKTLGMLGRTEKQRNGSSIDTVLHDPAMDAFSCPGQDENQADDGSLPTGSSVMQTPIGESYISRNTRLQPRCTNNNQPEELPSYANTQPTTNPEKIHAFGDRHSTVSRSVEDRHGENEGERCLVESQPGEVAGNAEKVVVEAHQNENAHELPSKDEADSEFRTAVDNPLSEGCVPQLMEGMPSLYVNGHSQEIRADTRTNERLTGEAHERYPEHTTGDDNSERRTSFTGLSRSPVESQDMERVQIDDDLGHEESESRDGATDIAEWLQEFGNVDTLDASETGREVMLSWPI
ncbi:hypothetical protein PSPO01_04906 [Paraphaeosphaeria sporulosa]